MGDINIAIYREDPTPCKGNETKEDVTRKLELSAGLFTFLLNVFPFEDHIDNLYGKGSQELSALTKIFFSVWF